MAPWERPGSSAAEREQMAHGYVCVSCVCCDLHVYVAALEQHRRCHQQSGRRSEQHRHPYGVEALPKRRGAAGVV